MKLNLSKIKKLKPVFKIDTVSVGFMVFTLFTMVFAVSNPFRQVLYRSFAMPVDPPGTEYYTPTPRLTPTPLKSLSPTPTPTRTPTTRPSFTPKPTLTTSQNLVQPCVSACTREQITLLGQREGRVGYVYPNGNIAGFYEYPAGSGKYYPVNPSANGPTQSDLATLASTINLQKAALHDPNALSMLASNNPTAAEPVKDVLYSQCASGSGVYADVDCATTQGLVKFLNYEIQSAINIFTQLKTASAGNYSNTQIQEMLKKMQTYYSRGIITNATYSEVVGFSDNLIKANALAAAKTATPTPRLALASPVATLDPIKRLQIEYPDRTPTPRRTLTPTPKIYTVSTPPQAQRTPTPVLQNVFSTEKTDEGFIQTTTTYTRDPITGNIINAVTRQTTLPKATPTPVTGIKKFTDLFSFFGGSKSPTPVATTFRTLEKTDTGFNVTDTTLTRDPVTGNIINATTRQTTLPKATPTPVPIIKRFSDLFNFFGNSGSPTPVATTFKTIEKTDEGFITTTTNILRDPKTGEITDAKSRETTSKTTSTYKETATGIVRTDTTVTTDIKTGEVVSTTTNQVKLTTTDTSKTFDITKIREFFENLFSPGPALPTPTPAWTPTPLPKCTYSQQNISSPNCIVQMPPLDRGWKFVCSINGDFAMYTQVKDLQIDWGKSQRCAKGCVNGACIGSIKTSCTNGEVSLDGFEICQNGSWVCVPGKTRRLSLPGQTNADDNISQCTNNNEIKTVNDNSYLENLTCQNGKLVNKTTNEVFNCAAGETCLEKDTKSYIDYSGCYSAGYIRANTCTPGETKMPVNPTECKQVCNSDGEWTRAEPLECMREPGAAELIQCRSQNSLWQGSTKIATCAKGCEYGNCIPDTSLSCNNGDSYLAGTPVCLHKCINNKYTNTGICKNDYNTTANWDYSELGILLKAVSDFPDKYRELINGLKFQRDDSVYSYCFDNCEKVAVGGYRQGTVLIPDSGLNSETVHHEIIHAIHETNPQLTQDFVAATGCKQNATNPNGQYQYNEEPFWDYGKTNCAEGIAVSCGDEYMDPKLSCTMKTERPKSYEFCKTKVLDNKEFCNQP